MNEWMNECMNAWMPRNGAALDMRKSMDREGEAPLNLSLKSEPAAQNKSSHQSEYYASKYDILLLIWSS